MNEHADGWSAALTQTPRAVASRAHRVVDVGDSRRRHHEAGAVEVAVGVGAFGDEAGPAGVEVGPHRRRHMRRHDAHVGTGGVQPGDLAGGDRSGADHQHVDPVEVEQHRVGEARCVVDRRSLGRPGRSI